MTTEFVANRETDERVIRDAVPQARQRLWIATADIKDMYVETGGRDLDAETCQRGKSI